MAYMTDAIRLQGEGKYPSKRWIEIIRPPKSFDPEPIINMILDKVASDGPA